MATIRPRIWEKKFNLDYSIPFQYRRPFVYFGPHFTLYYTGSIKWISSLGILFSLLFGLGNGNVGITIKMSRVSVPESVYTLYDDLMFPQMRNQWIH